MDYETADRSIPPNDSPRFAANLSWLVFSGAVSVANSVLVWVFMARWRNTEELGGFTIVMGLYALFYNICSLNLSPLLVREISRRSAQSNDDLKSFIGTAAVFLLISGTICAALMAVGGLFLSASAEIGITGAVLSFALIPTAFSTLGESNAVAFGRGRVIAGVTTFENILRTVVPLFLIAFDYPLWAICLSFVVVRVITAIIYFYAGKIGLI